MTYKFLTLLLMIGLYLVPVWASDDSEGEVNPNEATLEESVNESLKQQHELDKKEAMRVELEHQAGADIYSVKFDDKDEQESKDEKSDGTNDAFDDDLDSQEHQANSSFVDPEVAADFQPVARDH
ncbi:MAG: hypothetical protein Q9M21_06240 [Mariprofundaceae bacterium]|nr:hypothetical protein [Mariprofundaceae bacterium]